MEPKAAGYNNRLRHRRLVALAALSALAFTGCSIDGAKGTDKKPIPVSQTATPGQESASTQTATASASEHTPKSPPAPTYETTTDSDSGSEQSSLGELPEDFTEVSAGQLNEFGTAAALMFLDILDEQGSTTSDEENDDGKVRVIRSADGTVAVFIRDDGSIQVVNTVCNGKGSEATCEDIDTQVMLTFASESDQASAGHSVDSIRAKLVRGDYMIVSTAWLINKEQYEAYVTGNKVSTDGAGTGTDLTAAVDAASDT